MISNELKLIAINGLSKQAQTQYKAHNIADKRPPLTPEERKRARALLDQRRLQNARAIRRGGVNRAGNYGILDGMWDATKQVGSDLADGTVAANLGTGMKSIFNGVGQGLVAAPGFLGGLVGGTATGLVDLIRNGDFASAAAAFGSGMQNTEDWINNHAGIGSYNLARAKNSLDELQTRNLEAFAKRNAIDPENGGFLDTMAMGSQHLAHGAGQAIGEFTPAGTVVLRPLKTVKSVMSTAGKAGRAVKQTAKVIARSRTPLKKAKNMATAATKNYAKNFGFTDKILSKQNFRNAWGYGTTALGTRSAYGDYNDYMKDWSTAAHNLNNPNSSRSYKNSVGPVADSYNPANSPDDNVNSGYYYDDDNSL